MNNIAKLKACLPLNLWGINQAKIFPQLVSEIEAGETEILWEGQKPIRCIRVARVDVQFLDKHLIETKQVFTDGRTRIRNIRGISEKLHQSENFLDGAVRGIREELGLALPASMFNYIGENLEMKESPSYPGLETRYVFGDFSVELPGQLWQREFVAIEDYSTTYFGWAN